MRTVHDILQAKKEKSANASSHELIEPGAINIEGEEATSETIKHNSLLKKLLNQLKPIDYYLKADVQQGEKLSKKNYLVDTIEEILSVAKQNNWGLSISDAFVYVYNGAFWRQLEKSEMESFLGAAARKLGVDRYDADHYVFRSELLKQFFTAAKFPKPLAKEGEILINLQNGTFVINKDDHGLRKFQAGDFLTYQLPFSYDPKEGCPGFKRYLERVLPDKEQQMILCEYIAYLFVKQKTLKLEKALVLYGRGANGKSVFFDVITGLLGANNISHYSLDSLTQENGYHRAKLKGKLCNYAPEISTKMNSTFFKQIVSGEPVEARLPYGEPFMLEDYAKFIFNTNELPKDVEHNVAFFRRFIILDFSVTIPEEERDPELANTIIKTELAGVFNWVLEGLDRLMNQKNFTYSAKVQQLIEQYRQESDSVQLFLSEYNYHPDHLEEIKLNLLYKEYKDYCRESNYIAVSRKVFVNRLHTQGYVQHRKKEGNVIYARKKPFDGTALPAPATP